MVSSALLGGLAAGGAGLVVGAATSVLLQAVVETAVEEGVNCLLYGWTEASGIIFSLMINLAPGVINEKAIGKHIDDVFKNTDEIIDITGKIIKREEYLEFIRNLQKTGIKIEYDKIFEIYKKIDGDIFKLPARQIENVIEYGKHIDKIEIEKIKNVEIIGSVKGLGKEEIINIYEAGKYAGKIDIEEITKGYGKEILKDQDNILFAINNPCTIAGGGIKELLIPKVTAACKIPVDGWDGVKLKRGNVASDKINLIRAIREFNPDLSFENLSNLEYNHRIPVSIAKQYPEAVSAYLKDLGIDDLNKFGDLMNHSDNIKHYWSWRDALKGKDNITKDTIAQIIEDIEVNGINRGIDYINNVYR